LIKLNKGEFSFASKSIKNPLKPNVYRQIKQNEVKLNKMVSIRVRDGSG
jgi:hypothetical protein